MRNLRIPLRIVFYREDDQWIAHCLEFDLCGNADSQKGALASLAEAIRIQLEDSLSHNNPRNLFSPADGRLLEMFSAGKDIAIGELHLKCDSVEVGKAEMREYSEGEFALA